MDIKHKMYILLGSNIMQIYLSCVKLYIRAIYKTSMSCIIFFLQFSARLHHNYISSRQARFKRTKFSVSSVYMSWQRYPSPFTLLGNTFMCVFCIYTYTAYIFYQSNHHVEKFFLPRNIYLFKQKSNQRNFKEKIYWCTYLYAGALH